MNFRIVVGMFLVGGLFFGPFWGAVYTITSSTLRAGLAFLVTYSFLPSMVFDVKSLWSRVVASLSFCFSVPAVLPTSLFRSSSSVLNRWRQLKWTSYA